MWSYDHNAVWDCKWVSDPWLEYDNHLRSCLRLFTKITPICCPCPQGKPHIWQEAENWYRGRLTIKSETFCDLKEIELKTIKMQQKNQQCVIIVWSRITNKMPLLPDKPFSRINWKLVCGWINKLWRALPWFRRIEVQSSEL